MPQNIFSPLSALTWCNHQEFIFNSQTNFVGDTAQFKTPYHFDAELNTAVSDVFNELRSIFGLHQNARISLAYKSIQHQPGYSWAARSDSRLITNTSFAVSIKSARNNHGWTSDENQTALRAIPPAKDINVINATMHYSKNGINCWDNELTVSILVDLNGVHVPISMDYDMACQLFELKVDINTFELNGVSWPQQHSILNGFRWDIKGLFAFHLKNGMDYDAINNLLLTATENPSRYGFTEPALQPSGVSKVMKTVEPLLGELRAKYPLEYCVILSVINDTKRTVQGVKCSALFNEEFSQAKSAEDLYAKLHPVVLNFRNLSGYYGVDSEYFYSNCESFKAARKKVLQSQSHRAFSKVMQEIEGLNLDPEVYPLLWTAITEGEIPLGTFFRKSEQYFLLNDNFLLWEEMLAKYPEVTKSLAQEVSRRTTYEKDLMSYFYFVLYALPEYLKEHTDTDWTCEPKLVESPSELEPPTEDKNGVRRKRSALTPIVDNENYHVVVPYASLAIPGRQTTYCYSHDYHVLTRGFSFNGSAVMKNVESKLNGRDDYGLMFYTLTGSIQGRGYPTFLIIFERRSTGTHVHFHRTHPCRSKEGDYNPIHNWVKVCYNWMIGNVAASRITVQQGDLAFISVEKPKNKDFLEQVEFYDNHEFDHPVGFEPYTSSKSENILGHFYVPHDTYLRHHEHEDVPVPAGYYDVRQARSWEANPKGVWSLRID